MTAGRHKCKSSEKLQGMNLAALLPESLGDFLLTTPSLQALEKIYPSNSITWILPENLIQAADLLPLEAKRTSFSRWNGSAPDLTICFPPAVKFYRMARRMGGKIRLGYVHQKMLVSRWVSQFCLTQRWICPSNAKIHELEAYGKILELLHIPFRPELPPLVIPETVKREAEQWLESRKQFENQKVISVHLNDRWTMNPLPLLREIRNQENCLFVALFSEPESEKAGKLLQETALPIATPGTLSLAKYAAVMQQSNLLMAVDGGPVHLAASLRVPVAAFYPQENFEARIAQWHPWSNSYLAFPLIEKSGKSCAEKILALLHPPSPPSTKVTAGLRRDSSTGKDGHSLS